MDGLQSLDLGQLDKLAEQAGPYHEILRCHRMSAGLYVLPVSGADHQYHDASDEVYLILRGRGTLRVRDQDHEVGRAVSCQRTTAKSASSPTSLRTCTSWSFSRRQTILPKALADTISGRRRPALHVPGQPVGGGSGLLQTSRGEDSRGQPRPRRG